jgi:hypothetical protein
MTRGELWWADYGIPYDHKLALWTNKDFWKKYQK